MFQDMEISKALAEVFESKPEAKEILEDSAAESWSCVAHWGIGGRIHVPRKFVAENAFCPHEEQSIWWYDAMGDDSDFPLQSSKILMVEDIGPITFGILNLIISTNF